MCGVFIDFWKQLGFAETILLNASLSQDPNESDGRLGLEFDWACIPHNETLASRLPFNSKSMKAFFHFQIKPNQYSFNWMANYHN